MRLLMAVTIALMLVAPAAADSFWDALAPDAGLLARPIDGSITGDTYEGASWEILEDPWESVLNGRDVWLDVITPTHNIGLGGSIDIIPDEPACLGVAWRDPEWFGYLGAHLTVSW